MSFIRETIKEYLLKRGMVISRPPGQFAIDEYKLGAMVARGLEIRAAIDGGAAEGTWTRMLKKVAPKARVLMIEPRQSAQAELQKLGKTFGDVSVAQVLLGRSDGVATFHESGHQSSILGAANGTNFGRTQPLEMLTLDTLLARFQFPPPDLVKLDLQGYEIEALRGATQALARAQVVILEVTFIPFLRDMPLVGDVVPFMSQRGFRVYDILALWHRPLDGALVQGDFAFVRHDHPLIRDTRWDRTNTPPAAQPSPPRDQFCV